MGLRSVVTEPVVVTKGALDVASALPPGFRWIRPPLSWKGNQVIGGTEARSLILPYVDELTSSKLAFGVGSVETGSCGGKCVLDTVVWWLFRTSVASVGESCVMWSLVAGGGPTKNSRESCAGDEPHFGRFCGNGAPAENSRESCAGDEPHGVSEVT